MTFCLLKMSVETYRCGRKRKRSFRSVRPNSSYYLLGQDGDSSLPGPSRSRHTDLEEQLRADPLFLLRVDVVLCDDEASTSSKRSRPIATSSLSRETSSPQPGTSRDLYAPTEVQHRARSPSRPSVEIPVTTEDFQLPSMERADAPAVMM